MGSNFGGFRHHEKYVLWSSGALFSYSAHDTIFLILAQAWAMHQVT
jgi:hypothetical protein